MIIMCGHVTITWDHVLVCSLPTDVPASGMYFAAYEGMLRYLAPGGRRYGSQLVKGGYEEHKIKTIVIYKGRQ